MRSILLLFTVALATGSPSWYYFGSSHNSHVTKHRESTIGEHLGKEEKFSKLLQAMEKNRGLRDDLDNKDRKMTFIAPTNKAFEEMEKMFRGRNPEFDINEVLNYHFVDNEQVSEDDLWDGLLLDSRLKSEKLGGRNQKLRVSRLLGRWFINMYALIESVDDCTNGNILVVDRIIVPPMNAMEKLFMSPMQQLSTFSSAILSNEKLIQEFKERSEITVMAPTNDAWKRLGMRNLLYLFSPVGEKDLMKLVSYHVGTELRYTTDMKRGRSSMRTLEGSSFELDTETHRSSGHDEKEHEVKRIMINKFSRMMIQDLPCENGVINVVNEVLVPEEVLKRLPEPRWGE